MGSTFPARCTRTDLTRRMGLHVRSLLARLLLIVSIALVPALAFQVYTESGTRRIREHLVEDEALRLVRLVSAEQQRIIEGAEQVLDTLSSTPAVQDNIPELCRRQLANLLRLSPRYSYGAVIGLDGYVLCAPAPFDSGIDLSGRTYFRLALQTGGFVLGDYTVGRLSGGPTIHAAKPFRNHDGKIAGVIVLALSLDWLAQAVERLRLPPEAIVTIADRNGIFMIRHPGQERFAGTPIPAGNRFILDGTKIGIAPMMSLDRNRPVIVAYSPPGADPKGLAIGVGLDRETTFATVTQDNRLRLALIVLGAGLALATTALLGARLIGRPVNRLLQAAERWRTGDLAARTGLRDIGGEFGRLGAAFDGMAAALEARERALRTALESTGDGVVVLDRCWRFTYLNANAKALIGRGRDLLGQVVWEVFPGLEGTVFADAYRAAMEQGQPTHAKAYYAPLDGHFEAHIYPSNDGITVFYHDVTEERRIAAALAGSETRLSLAQEAAGIGIWEYDSATDTAIWSPGQYPAARARSRHGPAKLRAMAGNGRSGGPARRSRGGGTRANARQHLAAPGIPHPAAVGWGVALAHRPRPSGHRRTRRAVAAGRRQPRCHRPAAGRGRVAAGDRLAARHRHLLARSDLRQGHREPLPVRQSRPPRRGRQNRGGGDRSHRCGMAPRPRAGRGGHGE